MGVIRLPDFVVARAVGAKTLVPILPKAEFREYGVFLVSSSKRRVNKRMRAFMTALEDYCAALCQ